MIRRVVDAADHKENFFFDMDRFRWWIMGTAKKAGPGWHDPRVTMNLSYWRNHLAVRIC